MGERDKVSVGGILAYTEVRKGSSMKGIGKQSPEPCEGASPAEEDRPVYGGK